MKALFICFILGLLPGHVYLFGQVSNDTVIIEPGDVRLRSHSILPYHNRWTMFEEDKNGNLVETGIWNDTVKTYILKGENIIERRQSVFYKTGLIRRHIDKANSRTLLSLEVIVTNEINCKTDTVINVTGKNNSISGYRYFNVDGVGSFPGVKTFFWLKPEKPVFDWHLWGIIIRSLPLKENFYARFLTHNSPGYTNSPFLWVSAFVKETETIYLQGYGNVDCWKVNVTAEAPWTFWISKTNITPPICRIKIEQPDGNILWWK